MLGHLSTDDAPNAMGAPILLLLWLFSLAAHCQQPDAGRKGAVTSEVDVCSKIGVSLLQDGGNAADAVGGFVWMAVFLVDLCTGYRHHALHRRHSNVP